MKTISFIVYSIQMSHANHLYNDQFISFFESMYTYQTSYLHAFSILYHYFHMMMMICGLCALCSAGIGRTGAFCSLSIAIDRVKAEGLVDIYHTVKHLRTQRPHMVQSEVRREMWKLYLLVPINPLNILGGFLLW